MSFENYYLQCLFKETGEDLSNIEKCSAVRNSLVRIYNQGVNGLSNTATCAILDQQLGEYSQVFNDDSKEGCMTDMLALVKNHLKGKVQTRHCANWKSGLRSSQINAEKILTKSLDESGHCKASKGLPCDGNKINRADLKKLLKKKDVSKIILSTPKTIDRNIQNQSDAPKTNGLFKYNIQRSNSNEEQKVVNSSGPSKQNFNSLSNQQHQGTLNSNFTNYSKTGNSRMQSNYNSDCIQNNTNGHKSEETSNFLSSPFESSSGKQSVNNFIDDNNKLQPDYKRIPQNYTNGINNASNNYGNEASDGFWTARTELQIQNKKKYGNAKQNVPKLPVVVKRSLGTTRSSVQNRFIPPLAANSESQLSEIIDETVEDEKLKHIDPKMVEFIRSEIIDSNSPVSWDDIAGLEFAKSAIQEAVVWPLLRPDIFTGLRRPPRGILLFGPPGTGKTLIGKCVASQCSATFFSISASSLTSKWIGDGEKMVRALFAVAKCHQPAVVFIDEIDSLLTKRSDTEHEATRRIKTEFLVQLDGAATGDEDRFLVIGATNRPQELDEAARRRLVKRLYIPLPSTEARKQIVNRLMSTERNSLNERDIDKITQMTDGYSGSDMKSLCTEAALGPIRAVPLSQITNIQCDQVRPVNAEDFDQALTRVRPSVSGNDLEHYKVWDNTYGSGSGLH